MEITFKEYTTKDKDLILKWLAASQDYVASIDPLKRVRRMPGLSEKGLEDFLKFVKDGQGKIYIAYTNNKPIGFIGGAVNKQTEENLLETVPTKLGVISELYLEEEYRGKGIAPQLMKLMEDYFKRIGCDSIWINVVAFNPAHEFYKKGGYVDREIGMIKKI